MSFSVNLSKLWNSLFSFNKILMHFSYFWRQNIVFDRKVIVYFDSENKHDAKMPVSDRG